MRVAEPVHVEMRRLAEACAPRECVGALLGNGEVVAAVLPLENSALEASRSFEVSAAEYLRAEREAASRGLEVLGVFHSHVDAPAVPSPRDLELARHFRCAFLVEVRDGVATALTQFHGAPPARL